MKAVVLSWYLRTDSMFSVSKWGLTEFILSLIWLKMTHMLHSETRDVLYHSFIYGGLKERKKETASTQLFCLCLWRTNMFWLSRLKSVKIHTLMDFLSAASLFKQRSDSRVFNVSLDVEQADILLGFILLSAGRFMKPDVRVVMLLMFLSNLR